WAPLLARLLFNRGAPWPACPGARLCKKLEQAPLSCNGGPARLGKHRGRSLLSGVLPLALPFQAGAVESKSRRLRPCHAFPSRIHLWHAVPSRSSGDPFLHGKALPSSEPGELGCPFQLRSLRWGSPSRCLPEETPCAAGSMDR